MLPDYPTTHAAFRHRMGAELLAYIALAYGFTWMVHGSFVFFHIPFSLTFGTPGMLVYKIFGNYVYGITCLTTVMVLLYNRSGGSVLIGMLFHASMNIAAYRIRIPAGADITNSLLAGMAIIAALCLPRPWFGRHGAEPALAAART